MNPWAIDLLKLLSISISQSSFEESITGSTKSKNIVNNMKYVLRKALFNNIHEKGKEESILVTFSTLTFFLSMTSDLPLLKDH